MTYGAANPHPRPPRPALIAESDLETFIASQDANRQKACRTTTDNDAGSDTSQRARRKWLSRKLTGRST